MRWMCPALGVVCAAVLAAGLSCRGRAPAGGAVPASAPATPISPERSTSSMPQGGASALPAPLGPSPPIEARVGVRALDRTGRPVVGVAFACTSEVPQSPLTAEGLQALGTAGVKPPPVSLPSVAEMDAVRVTWRAATSGESHPAELLWAVRGSKIPLYVSPWLEVLQGGPDTVAAVAPCSTDEVLDEGLLGDSTGAEGAPSMALGGLADVAYGLPTRRTAGALRACLLAGLGRQAEATEAARKVGPAPFEELSAALAYVAHRTAVEGLADGWSRARALDTIERAWALADGYAGRQALAELRAVLGRMISEDNAPPRRPVNAGPGSVQLARFYVWHLRDVGGPTDEGRPVGDPVSLLIQAGSGATEALNEALLDDRLTRQLAARGLTPLPDLVRFGDLALQILEARSGRSLLGGTEATRLFELPAGERESAVARIRSDLRLRAPRTGTSAPRGSS